MSPKEVMGDTQTDHPAKPQDRFDALLRYATINREAGARASRREDGDVAAGGALSRGIGLLLGLLQGVADGFFPVHGAALLPGRLEGFVAKKRAGGGGSLPPALLF